MILWGTGTSRFYNSIYEALEKAEGLMLYRAFYDTESMRIEPVVSDIQICIAMMCREALFGSAFPEAISTIAKMDPDFSEITRNRLRVIFTEIIEGIVSKNARDPMLLKYRMAHALTYYESMKEQKTRFVKAVMEEQGRTKGHYKAKAFVELWMLKNRPGIFLGVDESAQESHLAKFTALVPSGGTDEDEKSTE